MSPQPPEPNSNGAEPLKVWNCVNCRRRKVRCDRRHPCAPCTRNKTDCVFPVSGRIPRRSRDANHPKPPAQKQAELVGRLRRLEAMVGGLSSQVEDAVAISQSNHPAESSVSETSAMSNETGLLDQRAFRSELAGAYPLNNHDGVQTSSGKLENTSESPQNSDDFGVLEMASNGDLVVGTRFWTVFCKEVEDIFEAVQGHTVTHFDDDSSSSMSDTPRHTGYYNFLLRSTSAARQNKEIRPLLSQMLFLWHIYVDKVDPFLKILHVPTMTKVVREIRGSYDSLSLSMQALVLAISLAAIMSLDGEEVNSNFNTGKDQLIANYRLGTEQALGQADFLNKPDITLLQALAIYLSVLQRTGETRPAWLLAGILIRTAASLKLHRDASNFAHITTFETEIQRRLWWQICFIDSRSEDLQVSGFKLSESMFDTEIPANTDDANLDPEMSHPLVLTEGWTDMTIFLIRCEVWKLSHRLQSVTAASFPPDINKHIELFQQSQARIENTYLKYLDSNQPLHSFVATSVRLFLTKADLILHAKLHSISGQPVETLQSDKVFRSSLSIIEYTYSLQNEPTWSCWRWQIQGQQPPWQALRVILNQLSTRAWEPICERAWSSAKRSTDSLSKRAISHPRYQQLLVLSSTVQKRVDENFCRASGASTSAVDDQPPATAFNLSVPPRQATSAPLQEMFFGMPEWSENVFGDGSGPEMDWQVWDEIAGDLEFWDIGGI